MKFGVGFYDGTRLKESDLENAKVDIRFSIEGRTFDTGLETRYMGFHQGNHVWKALFVLKDVVPSRDFEGNSKVTFTGSFASYKSYEKILDQTSIDIPVNSNFSSHYLALSTSTNNIEVREISSHFHMLHIYTSTI